MAASEILFRMFGSRCLATLTLQYIRTDAMGDRFNSGPKRWASRDFEKGLVCHFKEVATRHPEKIAVQLNSVSLPYRNLDKRSDRIAFGLLQLIEQDEGNSDCAPIGICCHHNENAVTAMLSVLKAGRAHVWLSPSDDEGRRRTILSASGIETVLLETGKSENIFDQDGIRTISMEDLLEKVPAGATSDESGLSGDPSCDFAISFTSGSTAEPKGVRRTQRALLHQADYLTSKCELSETDRIAMIIPATFGSCSNDIFAALLTGASLHPFNLAEMGTASLAAWLQTEGITYCHCVPSVFRSVLAQMRERNGLPDMRWFKLGGEPLFPSDIELFRQRVGGATRILHSYGATETGGTICADVISHSSPLTEGALPVGKPIPGKRISIVSKTGKKLGPGETGRIVVTSRYLAAGYHVSEIGEGDEIFSRSWKGETRFLSRDLGVLNKDGRLVLKSRFDGVVKLLGQRVDIEGIEVFFRRQNLVADCVAIANHERGRIDVFVVGHGDEEGAEVSRSLHHRFDLQGQPLKIPVAIHVLDRFPIKPNGKVDRNELMQMDSANDDSYLKEFSPRSDLESQIFEIWTEILDRDDFGIYDDYFSLGGDSLGAINFQTRLLETTGFSVSAAQLLSNFRTIAEIAEAIHHESLKDGHTEAVGEPTSAWVEFRSEGDGAPLVFFPGGYGGESELMLFARMIPWLNPGHPIYGLRATGLHELDKPPTSSDELADFYARLLQEKFGSANPVLIGNCIAGPVAVEVAARLRRVAMDPVLILLDSASRRGWFRKGAKREEDRELPGFVRAYYELLDGVSPEGYNGDLRLILTESFNDKESPFLGWDKIVSGEIRLDRVEGDHLQVLRESGDQMGRDLAKAITDELGRR